VSPLLLKYKSYKVYPTTEAIKKETRLAVIGT